MEQRTEKPSQDYVESIYARARDRFKGQSRAKALARIEEIRVVAGSEVAEGDVLVRLDARDLDARTREVEEAVYLDKRVEEVAVIGTPHPKWVEAVTAVVVPRQGETITEEEIVTLCKKELAGFKVPKNIIFVDALPKTPTGKILKRDMRETYKDLSK